MSVGIICIGSQLKVHESIKNIFPEYDLYLCNTDQEQLYSLYNKLSNVYSKILITSHNIMYQDKLEYTTVEFHPLDYVGGDYYSMPYVSVNELYNKTCNDPKALGFNNKGYIKSKVELEGLRKNDYLGTNGGIYLYSNRIRGNVNCNLYLPSSFLNMLPLLCKPPEAGLLSNFKQFNIISTTKKIKVAVNLKGYYGSWFLTKDYFHNVIYNHPEIEYYLFSSVYETVQKDSSEKVSLERLKQELSALYLYDSELTLSPDPLKLCNKYETIYGHCFDIIVESEFDCIIDKKINYLSLESNVLLKSNDDKVKIYYKNDTIEKTNIINYRLAEYDKTKSYTIVTALLDINRDSWKHNMKNFETYLNNLKNITKLNCNFYIFVDIKHLNITKYIRNSLNCKIVPIVINESFAFRYYSKIKNIMNSDFFKTYIKHVGNINSPQYNIPEYVVLLNSKVDLLYKACLDNPFNSDYFVWINAGFSNNDYNKIPTQWSPLCVQHPEHICISNWESVDKLNTSHLGLFKDQHTVLTTSLFGGSSNNIKKLHNVYYKTLGEQLDKNIVSVDSYTMSLCYKNNPTLFKTFSLKEVIDTGNNQYNDFKLLNKYNIAVISYLEKENKEVDTTIENLKNLGFNVKLYNQEEKEMNKVIEESCFSITGRYDIVMYIFNGDNLQFDIYDIKNCIKYNRLNISKSFVYGPYNLLINSKYC